MSKGKKKKNESVVQPKTPPSIYEHQMTKTDLVMLMAIAYFFSVIMRFVWIWQFQDVSAMYWNGERVLNTNDGFFFASGVQAILDGLHENNPRIPDMWKYGTVLLTALFVKITPFSLETVILYMPAFISSLIVVPILLIARLYGQTMLGFLAALIGGIAWSYYNRTMTGYYDTDMFSVMAPMFILFFLMKSTIDYNLRAALYAALAIAIYPFLYDSGRSLIYAMGIIYAMYLLFYHRDEKMAYYSSILVFLALVPFAIFVPEPYDIGFKMVAIVVLFFVFQKVKVERKYLIGILLILFVFFMYFGNVFALILGKVSAFIATGTVTEGLQFYGVHQTIREANKIPFEIFAKRISGSELGFIFSVIGYTFLVWRYRAFLLALPILGVGVFALWGGLRFTIYAVPIAAFGVIYLFFMIGELFKDNRVKYGFIVLATLAVLYPNVKHILNYKVGVVMKSNQIQDLVKLNEVSSDKDYTLAWWDYGYPLWYYAGTSTLIDGGKHQNDNFILSTILQTTSPKLAVNLSRLSIETYAAGVASYKAYIENGRREEDIPEAYKIVRNEKVTHAGAGPVTNVIFRNGQSDQKDPRKILRALEENEYPLPTKSREIYFYMPSKMVRIFYTITKFGNLDLATGKRLRKLEFYFTAQEGKTPDGKIILRNKIILDLKKGEIHIRGKTKKIKHFAAVYYNNKTKTERVQEKFHHFDGEYSIVVKNGKTLVMDTKTFDSMYVQMGLLSRYDTNLFEQVVSSYSSKIYRLKR
jgi:dolichyl-diphosphooligosaccharide--protein glycosyltransferase/undecaprenyl-diphosphooligosaccharide--protein glycosyltransferase